MKQLRQYVYQVMITSFQILSNSSPISHTTASENTPLHIIKSKDLKDTNTFRENYKVFSVTYSHACHFFYYILHRLMLIQSYFKSIELREIELLNTKQIISDH
jgi:hypothetical protein